MIDDASHEKSISVIVDASAVTHAMLTTQIVAAYVRHNAAPPASLPEIIKSVHATLVGLGKPANVEPVADLPTTDDIKRSVTPDHIISFIDGKPYKSLKRHLTKHGLDSVSYRKRYGLPVDYPIVTKTYSAQRSELAKRLGLGKRDTVADMVSDGLGQPEGAGPDLVAA